MHKTSPWQVVAGALLLAALAIGCGSSETPRQTRPTTVGISEGVVPVSCAIGPGGKADRICDPGVRNPTVTQDTIKDTICRPGWTATIRPPTSYTTPLKRLDMRKYGLDGAIDEYRYDHLIPLSLGGSPTNPGNLWPQPVDPSYDKDARTRVLKAQVCKGELKLAAAQESILAEWSHGEQ